jgi:hypothetical protein
MGEVRKMKRTISTDEDLEYIPGKEEELIQRLEKIMNRSRDQVIAYIESISSNDDLAG